MEDLRELEERWQAQGPSDDERFLPFLPYDLDRFQGYLERTLAGFTPARFVDVGCGIGSKILLVERMHSIPGLGVDRVAEYVAEARELGVDAIIADAFGWDGYQAGDLVYLNCPCRSDELEAELEQLIFQRMALGSALFMVNAAMQPAGWRELWVDGPYCGAWVKP